MILAITGPTSGIGAVTFSALTPLYDKVFFLARNEQKAKKEIGKLPENQQKKVHFIYMDLAKLTSVNQAARKIKEMTPQIDVLINNAGGIFQNKEITGDGFELSLSANHLGHFLLTHQLMPLLLSSDQPKVINVSSEAHKAAKVKFDDLNYESRKYSAFNAYANVKLFNILFTKSLAEKYGDKGLQSYALHPGVVKTNFANDAGAMFKFFWWMAKPFMITPEQGAKTSIFLAKTQLPQNQNGSYFKDSKVQKTSAPAKSKSMRDKLWEKSEKLLEDWMKK
jgi:NAD(P)-dependent dehydrogenase (short-subunit alcohol dehydrogenase family)